MAEVPVNNSFSKKLIDDAKTIPSPVFCITAAVALFCGFFVYGLSIPGVFASLFLLALAACASSDINAGVVPDAVLILIAVLGIVYFLAVEGWSTGGALLRAIGIVIVSVPMLLISLLLKGAFGGGDIKLMAAAGLFLGWKLNLAGAVTGMFISGFYGIYLLVVKKAGAKGKLKLAPFLAVGLGFALLFGNIILSGWYML